MKISALIDRLTYSSYAFNRASHPEVSFTEWRRIFTDVDEMEAMYQREKVA